MKLHREDGQALVFGVPPVAAMLGCAALVLDVNSCFRDKSQLQGNNATLYRQFTRHITKCVQVTSSNSNESDFELRTIQLIH
jgi:hypothetical protein